MKLDYSDTLALLDRLLESEPKTDRPGGFTVRLRRLRDLVAESESADLSLAAIYGKVFPGVSKNSLRTTMMEFRKSLAQAVEKAGLRFELIRPDARGVEADEVICSFEGEALPVIFNNADAENALSREIEVIEPRARATRVFVSFAIADRKLATEFTQQLKVNLPLRCAEPVNLWRFDEKGGILPGEDNEAEIRKRMNESQFGILLVSPTYLDRPFIQRVELPHFLGPAARAHPIPVAMADFTPGADRHPLLDPTNVFQYKGKSFAETDKKDRGAFVKALCEHIAALIAKYPPPPVPKADSNREPEDLVLRTGHEGSFTEDCEYIQPKGRAEHSLAKSAASSLDNSAGGSVPVLEALEQWVNNPKDSAYMALLGESGSGKTMTCSKLSQSLNAKHAGSSIYIDLRYLNESGLLKQNPNPKLEDILAASLSRSTDPAVTPQRVLDCVREKGTLLIWDGLDEVLVHLSAQEGEAIFSQLKEALPPRALKEGKGKAGRLLVACRTQYFRTVEHEASTLTQSQRGPVNASAPDQLRSRFRVLRLLPFDDDQIRAYLGANVPGLDVERAFDLIQKIHNLHDLAQRPYCLSLLRASLPDLDHLLAEGKRVRSVELYKSLVRSWLARDNTKHRFEEDDKPKLMARLAAWMWREGAKSMTAERLGGWLKETVFADPLLRSIYGDDFKDAKKRDELLQDFRTATFIARWDGDTFLFAHTSLQEYFLAVHLVDSLESGQIDEWVLPQVNRETLDFAAEIFVQRGQENQAARRRIEESLSALLGESKPGRSENALAFLLRLHALGESDFSVSKVDCRWLDLTAWEFSAPAKRPLLLAGVDFSGAILVRARFHQLNMAGSRWNRTDLCSAEFLECSLEEADFSGPESSNNRLEGARFRKCHFDGSRPPSGLHRELWIDLPIWSSATKGDWSTASAREISTMRSCLAGTLSSPSQALHLLPEIPSAIWSLGHNSAITSAKFSPDGSRILTGSDDSTARIWDAASGQCSRTLDGHSGSISGVAFSPDGSRILTGSSDNTARLWDAASGRYLRTLNGHCGPVSSIAFSPDGSRILTGSDDNTARLWDAASGQCLRTFDGHSRSVYSVAFSPDGSRILTGSSDNTARLWDAASGQYLRTLRGHSGSVSSGAFSPDGSRILTGSLDTTAKLWDLDSAQCLRTLDGHSSVVFDVAFSPDASRILTGSSDTTVRLWDAASGQCLRTFDGHSSWVTSVSFSPDGSRILTGCLDDTARLWDAASGRCLRTFDSHSGSVSSIALSPNRSRILTGSDDGTARLWDAASGQCLRIFDGHSGSVYSIAFSPDGSRILTGSDDARVWDAASGQCLRIFDGHSSWVTSVSFSPDGSRILTGSDDGTAKLWDTASARCLRTLDAHSGPISSVAFSPDGSRILTGSDEDTAKLWDTASARCLRTFSHSGSVSSVAFSPDGSRILTGSDDDPRVWDAASGLALYASEEDVGLLVQHRLRTDDCCSITSLGTLRVRLKDGTELDIAALSDGGYAVLEKAPGETRWRLARAKGDYWRYVNYVSDTLPDGTPGRVFYSADVLGEVPEL